MVGHWLVDNRGLVEVDNMLVEDVEGKEMVDIVKPERKIDLVRMSDKKVKTNWEVDIHERNSVAISCLVKGQPGMIVRIGNHWNVSEGIL